MSFYFILIYFIFKYENNYLIIFRDYYLNKLKINKIYKKWGLGIGDWGLGIGDWGLGTIPNPQSPIPNPQSPIPSFQHQLFILNNLN